MFGRGQLVFNFVEYAQKVRNRTHAIGDDRIGRVPNQLLQPLTCTIEHRADLQALGFAELFTQLDSVRCGADTRKDLIGDGSQRKHIQVLAGIGFGERFGSHVGGGGVFHQPIDVRRGSDRSRDSRGGGALAITDLPVEQLDQRSIASKVGHEDALRAEATVNDLLLVGIANDFPDLTHQIKLHLNAQLVFLLGQVMIQPHADRIVLKQQCGTEFMFGEVVGPQDARMFQRFQNLELTQSGALDGGSVFLSGLGSYQI